MIEKETHLTATRKQRKIDRESQRKGDPVSPSKAPIDLMSFH
jgi:hypothetical protein